MCETRTPLVRIAFAAPQDLSDGITVDCEFVPTDQHWVHKDLTDALRYMNLVRKILP